MRRLVPLAASIAVVACAAGAGAPPAMPTAGGPPASARFTLGHAVPDSVLARINQDVAADGAALPPGRGSVQDGRTLYAAQCAQCHGAAGQGMAPAYPALIGRDPKAENFVFASDPKLPHTIGNYWPYAATLFDYIKRAMPLASAGSLSDDQVYALTAYLLAANGVIADSVVLDAAELRRVKMPYADRFVPDDRRPPGLGSRPR